MKPIGAVHQFHPTCESGDGVTRSLFLTQKLLRRLGYESEIFCEQIPPQFARAVHHLSKRDDRPGDVLLFHHSLGYRNVQWLRRVVASRVLVYHSITPDYLLPEGELRELSRLGRDQLQELRTLFVASVADSEHNAEELGTLGYQDVRVLPLLVDIVRLGGLEPNQALMTSLQDFVNVLFVGRIADNKRQAELVDCFNLYHRHFEPRARLHLVGGCTSPGYLAQLRRKLQGLELEGVVSLPGQVSDEDLTAYFRSADVYLSLSEHEGFGMPLIEAMALGVPVVAHASTSVPWTVGPGGLLLATRDPEYVAATLDQVVSNPGLRRAMRRGAKRSLNRFSPAVLEHALAEVLQSLGGRPARPLEAAPEPPPGGRWRVEGATPAFVAALEATGVSCTELPTEAEDVTLRSWDPPRTEGMRGLVRVLQAPDWVERGLPLPQVDSFNQRLDLVTVRSSRMKKSLMDAGVKVPIAVVGEGGESGVAQRIRAAVAALSSLPQFSPALKLGWLTPWTSPGPLAEHAPSLLEALPGPILANRDDVPAGADSAHVVRCWDLGAASLSEVFEQIVARGLEVLLVQYDAGLFTPAALSELVARLRQRGIAVYCLCHSTLEFTRADAALAGATRLFVRSREDLARLEACGLGAKASMLAEGRALPAHLKNVVESCELNQRFGA